MTLALILVFAVLIRLQGDPINLSAFAPTIEAAVNRNFPGRIEIGGVVVSTHRSSDEPRLLLQDVRLRDAEGRLILAAPQFSARFDMAELLSGRIAPTSLTLIGPTAVLTRSEDGSFHIGIGGGPDAASSDDAESPVDAFSNFAAGLAFPERRRAPFTALNSIAVRDAYLIYRDEVSGRVWRAPGSFLRVWAGAEGARAFAKVTLSGADRNPTELTLTGRRLRKEDRVQLKANFSNLQAADLASQIPVFEWLRATEGALDGGLDLDLAPDGSLNTLAGSLRADSVVAELNGAEHLLDFADAEFGFDVATKVFEINALEASALGVTGFAAGRIALTLDQEQELSGAEVTLDELKATIARPDLFDDAIAVGGRDLRAAFDLSSGMRVSVGPAELIAETPGHPNTILRIRGAAEQTPDGIAIQAQAETDGFPIQHAVALWPKPMGRNARIWVAENVPEGQASNVRAQVNVAPGTAPEAVLEFDFAETSSTYFKPMPPLRNASGKAGLKDGVFWMDFDAATVPTSDGEIDISGSTLEIRNLFDPPSIARPVIRGVGPSAAVLNVIEHKPLQLPSKLGLSPSDVGGDVTANAVLEFPLIKTLQLSDILLTIDAHLTALDMNAPNTSIEILADEVVLTGDQTGMVVQGDATVDGRPASVIWREHFSSQDGPRRTLDFSTRFTRDQAVREGVPGVFFHEGAASVTGQMAFADGQAPRLQARIDLTGAGLEAPNIGWSKPVRTPAMILIDGALGDAAAIDMVLDMPGFEGEGVLGLTEDGVRIRVDRLELARIGAFKGDVRASRDKIDVNISTSSIDLEPFLSEGAVDTSSLDAPELSITLNADDAHLTGALWAGALSGRITVKDGRKQATFNGLINGDAPFTGEFVGAQTDSRLLIRSAEAGRTLKALGALQSGRGGELTLDLRLEGADAPIEGKIHIDGIVVTEAPVLAEMLSLASLVGAVDKLASGGVTFTTIESDFRAIGSQVYISNGAAYGPTVGLTAQGSYDLATEGFDLSGSISPAYVINGLINSVPLLGEVLTGGDGEGVFGIAYELKGSASAPEISVSPLSVFAIGPFRRLFSTTADDRPPEDEDPDANDAGDRWLDEQRKRRENRD